MQPNDLIPHLFRTEYSKIIAVLCKAFGAAHINLAEDMASETFLAAVETWPYSGIPDNPAAWLYAVAKNKARNCLTRNAVFARRVQPHLQRNALQTDDVIDMSPQAITDSQLQMLFAVCNAGIAIESQICLALRTLCGFGIDEIAAAFFTNKETINKRLLRAKQKLRSENIKIEMPAESELASRLDAVLRTIYLLFSEGYYSERQATVVRKELCLEAMKLAYLLLQNRQTNQHATNALMALMCFHASRLEARQDAKGGIILYDDQDENLWNMELVEKGFWYLQYASGGDIRSKYYIEASIAYWHTVKADTTEKWEQVLQLYNHLLQLEYTSVAALNRLFAVAKARGKQAALLEAENLKSTGNHFYYLLLAELYNDSDVLKAKEYLQKALAAAPTEPQKQVIRKKMQAYETA